MRFLAWRLTIGLLAAISSGATAQTSRPDFNRDVRPILSQHCFKCHGPDEGQRQAGLRLDQRTAALSLLSGKTHAIVPGKPQDSTLVKHDLQTATLHLLGLDHTRLTYHHAGRDYRLTDVSGDVIRDILA